jgi:hypothetical protein
MNVTRIRAAFAPRAEAFWRTAGPHNGFPRDIERAIAYALPLAIVRLPQLTVGSVAEWLRSRGIAAPSQQGCRPLRGCLFAYRGHGLVFIDGRDPTNEVRLVLAHEVAHFILHHLEPRQRALATLGETALEVLDGLRLPTPQERLAGVLGDIRLGDYLHAMARDDDGGIRSGPIAGMEAEADILGFELLAPVNEVGRRLSLEDARPERAAIACVLEEQFGLPRRAAEAWARQIAARYRHALSFTQWLGASP